ncbi:SDR family NAD(P)-dependent oxidoreductase [Govanella unica]|uniref:SDR family oxidoreductase n=1 Tax=Govanella unica TaxID=2975056 RepID=A0A9X3Z6R7_9PROT|nr:SDR family oxidoreductase [Govania unica]MDA5193293.1 SDR family oxidoreductase [Govania unica]
MRSSPAAAPASEAVAREIHDIGCQSIAGEADVSREYHVTRMWETVPKTFGRINIPVNNAGIAHNNKVEHMPVELWDRVLGVHLHGTFLMTRAILPGMYAQGSGRIINTASQLAYKGAPVLTAYTAAKGAILSFTRSIALEIGPGNITINCVAPEATLTPILNVVPEETLNAVKAAIPLGRIATVDDIVGSYVFLASEGARHYQGQCLSPNRGDYFV